jgi:hypothetical protein
MGCARTEKMPRKDYYKRGMTTAQKRAIAKEKASKQYSKPVRSRQRSATRKPGKRLGNLWIPKEKKMPEQKDNELVLFANDRKQKDTDPNAKGKGMVNGQEYWVAAWTNTSRDGSTKYQTIKLTLKDEQDQRRPAAGPTDDSGDDIPF